MDIKWIQRFLRLAAEVATWSKDGSTKAGAVIIPPDQRGISYGYNGYPKGVEDNPEDDRDTRCLQTVHAELNAILNAKKDLKGHYMFCTHPPCPECAKAIIQVGIKVVFYPPADVDFLQRWKCGKAHNMFRAAGVEYYPVKVP